MASAAPRLDLDLWVSLKKYEALHVPVSKNRVLTVAVLQSLKRHLWYLSEECVIFSLFDEELSVDERQRIAVGLLQCPYPAQFVTGKPVFPGNLPANPPLSSFVGPRSWLLFELTGAGRGWLQTPVVQWPIDENYLQLHNLIKDLEVVNDGAERSIKGITEYANITQDGLMRDDYIMVANCHREIFHSLKRDALRNLRL